ncbi:MAG: GNAT family N-acetyltransferase [Planctomycetota bacterium JB042]
MDDGYEITTDDARADVDAIHAFLVDAYWSKGIARETVERSLRGSLNFHLLRDGAQVGLTRVISDRATFAYLADVYVLEEHRRHGLGRRLVATAMAHPDVRGLRRWMLVTADAHGLYAKLGFRPPERPERIMERLG